MLSALKIENFAIVKHLELDLNQGLTAFTGETGAGKSIIIDALMLALGERADPSVIRIGEDKCDIQAAFTIEASTAVSSWLNDHDLTFDETLILRRVLTKEGRSKSYINGVVFPLQKIKELSSMLVDIHGQHQHQTLLVPNTHREQLDTFGHLKTPLQDVTNSYKSYIDLKNKLSQLSLDDQKEEKIQLLKFQIEELKTIAPQQGEMDALSEEHTLLYNAKSYLEKCQTIQSLLSDDEGPCVSKMLHQIGHLLADLKSNHTAVVNAAELIHNAMIQCDESLSEIQHFGNQVTLDPERLFEVETRMSLLLSTARKYQTSPQNLSEKLEALESQLQSLEKQEAAYVEIQKRLDEAYQDYLSKAKILTLKRQETAPHLGQAITKVIQSLGMPHGEIKVLMTPTDTPKPTGLDKVEYFVCTNQGATFQPLNKIASGGELSRISLAIQMITAQKGLTPTLIFDEVDVGIGGATASLVGQHLRHLGERLQIFCVTHQPQVAACAHQHLKVIKRLEDHQTFSEIMPLAHAQQIEEISRMLGGLTMTEQTRSHAREMIAQSTTSCA